MACWLALSSCTDHCCLGWATPPVISTADTVIHHREQGLLQGSCLGTSSWREIHTLAVTTAGNLNYVWWICSGPRAIKYFYFTKGCTTPNISWVLAGLAADLTVETTPACYITGLVVGKSSTMLWQAGQLNFIIDHSALLQLKQGDIVPIQTEGNTELCHNFLNSSECTKPVFAQLLFSRNSQGKHLFQGHIEGISV